MSAIIDSSGQPMQSPAEPSHQPDNSPGAANGEAGNASSPDSATGAEQDENSQVAKTFTQEDIDKIVSKERAKTEARAERRMLRALEKLSPRAPEPQQLRQPAPGDDRPSRGQYADDDAYIDALTDWKLDQRDRASNAEKQRASQKQLHDRTEKLYQAAGKFEGFDRESFDELPLTSPMVHALMDSDIAPQLMAMLSSNPEEVERIAALSPARQAAEIGKLEIKAASKGPRAKPSNAPDPISPVGARGGSSSSGDPGAMTNEQYRAYRIKQGAKWARGVT